MKKSWILAVALLAAACSPQVYPLYMDVRQPSTSGLKLAGKNISIVYMDGASPADSLFDRQAASAMARSLEEDYLDGREEIGIFRTARADSVSLELMHSLVMETEGDVVFVLSSELGEPEMETNMQVHNAKSADSAYVCPAVIPVKTQLYVYDSMGQDKVHKFRGSASMRPRVFNSGMLTQEGLKTLALRSLEGEAENVGGRISKPFLSVWNTESFSFYYYDGFSSEQWISGLANVATGHPAAAVDNWAPLLKSGSALSRACACYNIAMAFFLLEDYTLAERWLDQADKLEDVSLAPGLRKRIAARLEK